MLFLPVVMARLGIDISNNTSLVIALISELLGISKSQLLRMALFAYLTSIIKNNKNFSENDKQYFVEILILAINETSDKELNSKIKTELFDTLTQLQKSVSRNTCKDSEK